MKSESEIFNAVRKLDESQHEAFLKQACGDRHELRKRVEALLDANCAASPVSFSFDGDDATQQDSPSSDDSYVLRETGDSNLRESTDESTDVFSPGDMIGPYRLQEILGQGGMGQVWRAEQQKPVKRQVALKVILEGIGSREIIARFDAERQALSMMNHPNIAGILDANTTEKGQPYFVMELVEGVPLTTFCDENKVNIEGRLRLFIDICSGVQHAHQKGVIHRDLKPGNIIVGMQDGEAIPKVIDFGLAKAMESTQRLTDQSLFTGIGQILGTLKYMSPEQASLEKIDIDTRTDVYALGVILYELLTGTTPLDDCSIKQKAVLKVLEFIREKEPIKPSSKLSSESEEQQSRITNLRRTDIGRLNQVLAGDLDWIVVKALDKDRTRRYESASGFADDVERYLNSEPVVARPPSIKYRLRKFVKKNRASVISAAVLCISIVGGLAGTTIGMLNAISSGKLAEKRLQEAELARKQSAIREEGERLAKGVAEVRLVQLEKTTDILSGIFTDLNVMQRDSPNEPIESIFASRLVKAAKELNITTVSDTERLADILTQLGHAILSLGRHKDAIRVLQKAHELQTQAIGANHRKSLLVQSDLSVALLEDGQAKEAIQILEKILPLAGEVLGEDDPEYFDVLGNLGFAYLATGSPQKGLPLLMAAVEGNKKADGDDALSTLSAMGNLGRCYNALNDLDSAERVLQQALEKLTATQGESHFITLVTLANLGQTYLQGDELEKAENAVQKLLVVSKQTFGEKHLLTFNAANSLSVIYRRLGKLDECLEITLEVIDASESFYGRQHPRTMKYVSNLAEIYYEMREYDRAITLFIEVVKASEQHPILLASRLKLIRVYVAQERWREIEQTANDQIVAIRNVYENDSKGLSDQLALLGLELQKAKAYALAAPILQECLQIRETLAPNSWSTGNTKAMLGLVLIGLDKIEDGKPLIEAGYYQMKADSVSIPKPGLPRVQEALAELLRLSESEKNGKAISKWQEEQKAWNFDDSQ